MAEAYLNKFGEGKFYAESAGIEPGRFRVEWISASEGNKFAEVVTEFTKQVKNLGPQTKFKIEQQPSLEKI